MANITKEQFRKLITKAKSRSDERNGKLKTKGKKPLKFDITAAHLLKLWKKQHGFCNCCGIEMDLRGASHIPNAPNAMRATVDRLDANKGYVKGNVALAHFACNSFKGQLPMHFVYAIARCIVETFEHTYPETRVTVDKALKTPDGVRNYLYPRYKYVSSGKPGLKFSGEAIVRVIPNNGPQDSPAETGLRPA